MVNTLGVVGSVLLIVLSPPVVEAADVAGSSDHPLVSRYAGSEIIAYNSAAFDSYQLITDRITQGGGKAKNPEAVLNLEGKVTQITYKAPADRATLEILRNYEAELKEKGFEELFVCANQTCGGRDFSYTVVRSTPMVGIYEDQRYYAGRLKRDAGEIYVSLYLNHNKASGTRHANVKLDVIEIVPMEAGLVTVDAEAMNREILNQGHIAIYGVYFDTNQATLKPISKPTLDEIAKLLQDNPALKLSIVGHTDNLGDFDYNMDLSKHRAEAVRTALVSDYGVEETRLQAWGAGFLAPIASNKTEAGRAKNRRVELVEQ